MCISKKYKIRMIDVNVLYTSGDVYSDHYLVVCKVKVKRGRAPQFPKEEVCQVVRVERFRSEGCKKSLEIN